MYKTFLSNCRFDIQVSYVAVRQWIKILINGFPIKKVLAVGEWWWVLVDISWLVVSGGGYILAGGGWWQIYFGWRWVVMGGGGYILAGGGWWWMVVGGGIVQSNPKQDLAVLFSCKFCKIFKSNVLTKHLRVTASEDSKYFMIDFCRTPLL